MALHPDALVGSWALERFEVVLADGTSVFPMGDDARGRLMYGADGRMSATLSTADRPALSVPRLEAYGKAPADEKAAAFDSYMSYVGRFTVEDDAVLHHVELASVPNIVGVTQRRDASLHGDVLLLQYSVTSGRGTRTHTLQWRRL